MLKPIQVDEGFTQERRLRVRLVFPLRRQFDRGAVPRLQRLRLSGRSSQSSLKPVRRRRCVSKALRTVSSGLASE